MLIKQTILFNKTECNMIINLIKTCPEGWEFNNRKYNSLIINYNENTKWLFDKLKDFFELETGFKIRKNKEQIHFHKFVKDDWFDKHNDLTANRVFAVGVLLNDNFDGGDFKLYNPNEIILNKTIGNTYVFNVNIMHEITPILEGERCSLLWFLERDHIKLKINNLI